MIVITGGAGFIGSTLAKKFDVKDLILIDKFSDAIQRKYINQVSGARLVRLQECKQILNTYKNEISCFYHLGANSSTDQKIFSETVELNIHWSQYFWDFCSNHKIPFIYASSAATYGDGSKGFSDQMSLEELEKIKISSLYAWSKMYFDIFALKQNEIGKSPPVWYGLKFFNVYGVNEIHKENQSSVVHTFIKQLNSDGKIKLFKSYNKKYSDGNQQRDFVSVNYCIRFIDSIISSKVSNGLYNVGTGEAKTFIEFAKDIMKASRKDGIIEYIDMPESLKNHYQYFTKSENLKSKEIHKKINNFNFEEDLNFVVKEIYNQFSE